MILGNILSRFYLGLQNNISSKFLPFTSNLSALYIRKLSVNANMYFKTVRLLIEIPLLVNVSLIFLVDIWLLIMSNINFNMFSMSILSVILFYLRFLFFNVMIFLGDFMSIGIICEYNPFHNGHVYMIEKLRKMYPLATIVCVMSGNFVQRGEVSIISEKCKCDMALYYADLVIELPFVFCISSADIFAYGATSILNKLGVDYLAFGSDTDDINLFYDLINLNDNYDLMVKKYLSLGFNYPTSMSKALFDLKGVYINKPNDLLALSYMKNLGNLKPISIKRSGDYNSISLEGKFTSARSIRCALKEGEDISSYVPLNTLNNLNNLHFNDDYFDLLKYRIISEDISIYQGVDEGIEGRVKKVIYDALNFDDLVLKIKSKRYTYNRIQRMLICILCGHTKDEALMCRDISYIRVLGFNDKGRSFIKCARSLCDVPIITGFDKRFKALEIEKRAFDIYNMKKTSDDFYKPVIH